MGMIDLGKVKGEDAHFGAINATYTNDGGNPSVNIETDGEDTGKNVTFNFRNLVNDPLSESEIEQITEGNSIQSSNVMNGTRASALWSKIVEKFAAKLHKHKADDIDEGQFGTDRIEDGAITKNKIAANSVGLNQLDESARDSLSHLSFDGPSTVEFIARNKDKAWVIAHPDGSAVSLTVKADSKALAIGVKSDGAWTYRTI